MTQEEFCAKYPDLAAWLPVEQELAADLRAVLEKHGLELLTDDGITVFVDDYSDAWTVYFRPLGYVGTDKPWCQRAGNEVVG